MSNNLHRVLEGFELRAHRLDLNDQVCEIPKSIMDYLHHRIMVNCHLCITLAQLHSGFRLRTIYIYILTYCLGI
jgi:hypothetical protein